MLSNTLELDTGLNRLAFEKIGVILGIFLLLRNQLRTYQSDFRAVDFPQHVIIFIAIDHL